MEKDNQTEQNIKLQRKWPNVKVLTRYGYGRDGRIGKYRQQQGGEMFFDQLYDVIVREKEKEDAIIQILATIQPRKTQQNEGRGFFESSTMYVSTPPQYNLDLYKEKQYYLAFDNQLWHIKDKNKFMSVIPHIEYTAYLENNDDRFRPKGEVNTL